jgi:hypothetical protein
MTLRQAGLHTDIICYFRILFGLYEGQIRSICPRTCRKKQALSDLENHDESFTNCEYLPPKTGISGKLWLKVDTNGIDGRLLMPFLVVHRSPPFFRVPPRLFPSLKDGERDARERDGERETKARELRSEREAREGNTVLQPWLRADRSQPGFFLDENPDSPSWFCHQRTVFPGDHPEPGVVIESVEVPRPLSPLLRVSETIKVHVAPTPG